MFELFRQEKLKDVLFYKLVFWVNMVILLCLLAGCAHQNLYKEAVRLEQTGQLYAAAESTLSSLDKKPDYQKAQELLARIAEAAYSEREMDAEAFINRNKYPAAIEIYRELQKFSSRCKSYGTRIPAAAGVTEKIENVTNAGANKWYSTAEKQLKTKNYEEAINAYEKALDLNSNYKDAREKISLCHRSIGNQLRVRKKLRAAAKRFEKAASFARDDISDKTSAADCYYTLGKNFFDINKYRNAYADFERCLNLRYGYLNAEDLKIQCLKNGLVRLAISPFTNRTGVQPAGISVSDSLYDSIIADVQAKCSPFLEVIDRQNLNLLLQEQGLVENLMDPDSATMSGKIRGIHFILTGKLTRMTAKEKGPTRKTHEVTCEVPLYVGQPGRYGGIVYVRNGSGIATLRYNETKQENRIVIGGSLQITDAATGRSVFSKPFSVDLCDSIDYATNEEWSFPAAAQIEDTSELWQYLRNEEELRSKFSSSQNCKPIADLTSA